MKAAIQQEYKTGIGVISLMSKYNLSRTGVLYHLKGIPKHRKYKRKLDHNTLQTIDSVEKAYFIGFYTADGHLTDAGTIQFNQKAEDIEVLQFIKDLFKSDVQIGTYILNGKVYCRLQITSHTFKEQLSKIGVPIVSKTYACQGVPTVIRTNTVLLRAYIKGLIDGDGYVGRISRSPCIQIIGNSMLLDDLLTVVNTQFDMEPKGKLSKVQCQAPVSRLTFLGNEARKLHSLCYSLNIGLQRKAFTLGKRIKDGITTL